MSRPSRDSLHRDQRISALEDTLAQTYLRIAGRDAILFMLLSPDTDPEQRDGLLSRLPAVYAELDREIDSRLDADTPKGTP
jgi:hypothetical protein